MATEFKSPSGRLVLTVEGRKSLNERDIEWLKFVAGRPGLINERISKSPERTIIEEESDNATTLS